MARILIPTPLRPYTGNQDAVTLAGGTVGELLETLTQAHSELRRHLYTNEGRLRSFVNVYVNDEDIRYLSKESTPVSEQDVISIVPSIAGGTAKKIGDTPGWLPGSLRFQCSAGVSPIFFTVPGGSGDAG